MGTSAAVRFTYEDYKNLPEESRYEILDGDLLMSPSPTVRHQEVTGNLYQILVKFVREHRLGRVFIAPLDVVLSDTDVVQPDLLFVSTERSKIVKERIFGAPDLVVEVLSPATEGRDRTTKAKIYARAGVTELWLVDPETKTIHILKNGPGGFEPIPSGTSEVLPGCEIKPDRVF